MLIALVAALGYLPAKLSFGPWELFNPMERMAQPGDRRVASVLYPAFLPGLRIRWATATWGASVQGMTSPSLDSRDLTGVVTGQVQYTFLWLEAHRFFSFSFGDRTIHGVVNPLLLYESVGVERGVAFGVSGGVRTRLSSRWPLDGWAFLGPLAYEVYSPSTRVTIPVEGWAGLSLHYPTLQGYLLFRGSQESGVGAGGVWWPHTQVGIGFSYQSWLAPYRIGGGSDFLTGTGLHFRFRSPRIEVAFTWLFMGGVGEAQALGIQVFP